MGADEYALILNKVLGTDWTGEDILTAGERIWNLEREFNLEAGVDPSQDTLPKRLLEDGIAEGPSKGHVTRLSEMLPEYYEVRGWTKEGIPTEKKKKELGI
jgi:aldehyde:ferredoxin oxidoreductase